MEIGLIGLGKMGANMAERLLRGGHSVIGYDRDEQAVRRIIAQGNSGADSIADLISKLNTPKNSLVDGPRWQTCRRHD